MCGAFALFLGIALKNPLHQQRNPRFSLEVRGEVDVARHLPLDLGTWWAYRHEESLGCRCGAGTVTATWNEKLEICGREKLSEGILIELQRTVSDFSARRSESCTEPWDPDLHRPHDSPRFTLVVLEGYVYESGDATTVRQKVEDGRLTSQAAEFFFPMAPGLRWSDRKREERDLEAARLFEAGRGPAPNPGMHYWLVNGLEEIVLADGTQWAWHLQYGSLGGTLHRWFADGVGVVRERFRHQGSFWERDSELVELHRAR